MNEQTQIEDKESSGWVPDPEPSPEKPKEFVNIKWAEIGTVVEGIYRKKKVDEELGEDVAEEELPTIEYVPNVLTHKQEKMCFECYVKNYS